MTVHSPTPLVVTREIRRAAEILVRFGAREVYLFGSRARGHAGADSDIDLAVRGLPPDVYYRAIGEVMCALDLPVDVIDLDEPGPLMDSLRREGDFCRVA